MAPSEPKKNDWRVDLQVFVGAVLFALLMARFMIYVDTHTPLPPGHDGDAAPETINIAPPYWAN